MILIDDGNGMRIPIPDEAQSMILCEEPSLVATDELAQLVTKTHTMYMRDRLFDKIAEFYGPRVGTQVTVQ